LTITRTNRSTYIQLKVRYINEQLKRWNNNSWTVILLLVGVVYVLRNTKVEL